MEIHLSSNLIMSTQTPGQEFNEIHCSYGILVVRFLHISPAYHKFCDILCRGLAIVKKNNITLLSIRNTYIYNLQNAPDTISAAQPYTVHDNSYLYYEKP